MYILNTIIQAKLDSLDIKLLLKEDQMKKEIHIVNIHLIIWAFTVFVGVNFIPEKDKVGCP